MSHDPGASDSNVAKGDSDKDQDVFQVEAIYRTVSNVEYPYSKELLTCKMMYLTNLQASKISVDDMGKVRQALDMKKHQLVIRLLPSGFGRTWWKAHPHWQERFPEKCFPAENPKEEHEIEKQLLLLAQVVLLPLAWERHALVIGTDACSLTAAFLQVSAPMQRTRNCPFNVLLFTKAYWHHMKAKKDNKSNAFAFHQSSKQWKHATDKSFFESALKERYGDDEAYWPQGDIFSGASHCIMIECVSETDKHLNDKAAEQFQNNFVSSLQREIPVLALQTFGDDKLDRLSAVTEHVNRGMPLLLLDSRHRQKGWHDRQDWPASLRSLRQEISDFHKKLHRKGKREFFTTSVLAYIKSHLDKVKAVREKEKEDGKQQQKRKWLWQAIEDCENQNRRTKKGSKSEQSKNKRDTKSRKSFKIHPANDGGVGVGDDGDDDGGDGEEENDGDVHDGGLDEGAGVGALRGGNDSVNCDADADVSAAALLFLEMIGDEEEWEANQIADRATRAYEEIKLEEKDPEKFKEMWRKNWMCLRGMCFHKYEELQKLAHLPEQSEDQPEQPPIKSVTSRPRSVEFSTDDFDAKKAEKLLILVGKEIENSKKRNQEKKTKQAFLQSHDKWLAAYRILKSDCVKAANLLDLSYCEEILKTMASKLDPLPTENTRETLLLLREAWNLVDVFHSEASRYKLMTKVLQAVQLLLSTAIVLITLLGAHYSMYITESIQRILLLIFTMLASFAAAQTTFFDPASKWMLLRTSECSLESEIWKFRARIAPEYSGAVAAISVLGQREGERIAEENFRSAMDTIAENVFQGASLKSTSIFAYLIQDQGTSRTSRHYEARQHQKETEPTTRVLLRRDHVRHGQWNMKGKQKVEEGTDNFHSPVAPGCFVTWRLLKLLEFYQQRIPKYSNRRDYMQAAVMVCMILSAFLSAMRQLHWTAIVGALSGALYAWGEFSSFPKKLIRYSGAANSLHGLLVWWQALSASEQKSTECIKKLILTTEEIASFENAGWLSDIHKSVSKLCVQSDVGHLQGTPMELTPPQEQDQHIQCKQHN